MATDSRPPHSSTSGKHVLAGAAFVGLILGMAAASNRLLDDLGIADSPALSIEQRKEKAHRNQASWLQQSAPILAVKKERFPPQEYPPMPAFSTLEIKSLDDQDVTVTDVIVNNKRECVGVIASLPKTLGTGDAIKVLPQCDPVKVIVSTDHGDQLFTWDQ
ncbi:hypothetical protein ACQR1Y_18915 [Bradyrhizobium sp. HKCCYLRH3099]|uniref:hypothetical protein n=1 Tax=unclassified Bradyrhizobium TaxID=2631580 RepID=UPI003EBBBB91